MKKTISLILFLTAQNIFACSSFILKDNKAVLKGSALDYPYGNGIYVVDNKINEKRFAFTLNKTQKPTQWTKKYKSYYQSPIGFLFATEGINEHGLTAQVLTLMNVKNNYNQNKPTITDWQIVNLILDTCKDLNCVKNIFQDNNILDIMGSGILAKLHYHVCDKNGQCLALESLNGKYKYKQISYITNINNKQTELINKNHCKTPMQTMNVSYLNLTNYETSGISRFFILQCNANETNVFDVLNKVKQSHWQWHTRYDVTNLTVDIKTKDGLNIVHLNLKDLFNLKHSIYSNVSKQHEQHLIKYKFITLNNISYLNDMQTEFDNYYKSILSNND